MTNSKPELALIVGAARSGTTLLRVLLDAHPEIGSPAEAGLPGLMAHMAGVWLTVDADFRDSSRAADPGAAGTTKDGDGAGVPDRAGPSWAEDAFAELPSNAREWICCATARVMSRYCDRGRKRLYVDKSLDSVYHLALVRELFPEARFVLAFRHVMDTIASGLEASPWGFNAFGYMPYVQASPGNTVAALANYWLSHVSTALEWEAKHPDICHRVRYEDLVCAPEEVSTALMEFLGVSHEPAILEAAFDRPATRGPGDYKILHTRAVHTSSVGHGKRVPVGLLPPQLLAAVNEKLEALGYEPLDRSWNAQERRVDGAILGPWGERLRELVDNASVATDARAASFALVAEDHHALRWVVDPDAAELTEGDGDVDAVITGTAEDLVMMLTGGENLGVLLRTGRIRYVTAEDSQDAVMDLSEDLQRLLGSLRLNATRSNSVAIG